MTVGVCLARHLPPANRFCSRKWSSASEVGGGMGDTLGVDTIGPVEICHRSGLAEIFDTKADGLMAGHPAKTKLPGAHQ